jgi:hypothetical protein
MMQELDAILDNQSSLKAMLMWYEKGDEGLTDAQTQGRINDADAAQLRSWIAYQSADEIKYILFQKFAASPTTLVDFDWSVEV